MELIAVSEEPKASLVARDSVRVELKQRVEGVQAGLIVVDQVVRDRADWNRGDAVRAARGVDPSRVLVNAAV